jgi:hypothetical protein
MSRDMEAMTDCDSTDTRAAQVKEKGDDENELHVSTYVRKQKAVYIFRAFRC